LSTLGLEGNATLRDVQRAYTTLARQYHPDKAGEAEIEVGYHCRSDFHCRSIEASLTDILCCACALLLQHWRWVSGSYECLKVLLKSTNTTSDAIERQLYPDSEESSSPTNSEHARARFYRAERVVQLRNVSHALRNAVSDVAAWTMLGQTLLDIDKIGRCVSTYNGCCSRAMHAVPCESNVAMPCCVSLKCTVH
jgi:DnaJ domain